LAIVKPLSEIMGGDISMTLEEGKGSCFQFYLKLIESPKDRGLILPEGVQGLKILLVDDHPLQVSVLQKQLLLWGASIYVANSDEEALQKLELSNKVEGDTP
jgi:two-component system sensor histidine kinase/response regulator